MAEQVELHLEARLPELVDLIERGVFDDEEVRGVVQQRRRFEYRLKRPAGVMLEDFAAYIAYEKSLEMLRADRVRERNLSGTRSLSDHAILQHIYVLYHRALARFGGRAELWIELLEFARAQGSRQVYARACTRALQLHPRHAPLWAAAAEWHFEVLGNMPAARSIMQRALSINASDASLWLCLFRLELAFATALAQRHAVLGLRVEPAAENDAGALLSFDDICNPETTAEEATISPQVLQMEESAALEAVTKGCVALVVFDHCLGTVGVSMTAVDAFGFFSAAFSFDQNVHARMVAAVERRFPERVAFVEAIARSFTAEEFTPTRVQQALAYLDDAFKRKPSPDLLIVCLDYLASLPSSVDADSAEAVAAIVQEQSETLFEAGLEACVLSAPLCIRWLDCARIWNLPADRLEAIYSVIEQRFKSDAAACEAVLLSRMLACSDIASLSNFVPRLSKSSVSLAEACARQALDLAALTKECSLRDFATSLLSSAPFPSPALIEDLLRAVLASDAAGLDAVRAVCRTVSFRRLVCAAFYRAWIAVELSCHLVDASAVRALYQKAVAADGSDCDLWLAFIRFERAQGCYSAAARLFERGQKAVTDPVALARLVTDASVDR